MPLGQMLYFLWNEGERMKLKEAMQETGFAQKALRYYEEKQLVIADRILRCVTLLVGEVNCMGKYHPSILCDAYCWVFNVFNFKALYRTICASINKSFLPHVWISSESGVFYEYLVFLSGKFCVELQLFSKCQESI